MTNNSKDEAVALLRGVVAGDPVPDVPPIARATPSVRCEEDPDQGSGVHPVDEERVNRVREAAEQRQAQPGGCAAYPAVAPPPTRL